MVGRVFAMVANFLVQVFTVRALSKSEYGAFAYALSLVSMGTIVSLLGMNRATSRFVPIFQEHGNVRAMLGTIVSAFSLVLGLGTASVLLVLGLQGVLAGTAREPLGISLLLVLVLLVPLQALDHLFEDLLAVFVKPRAIFWRRQVLGPSLKLLAVLAVVSVQGTATQLAWFYVVGGLLGTLVYVSLFRSIWKQLDLAQGLSLRQLEYPVRRLLRFGLPLVAADGLTVLKMTLGVFLLEYFHGATQVADFRAVVPVAGLNMVVLQTFKLLYIPLASRLFARRDDAGMHDLYWKTTTWTAVVSFPIFALCIAVPHWLVTTLFGGDYGRSAEVLVLLAIGDYFNAAMGMNMHTLQAYGRIRYLLFSSMSTAVLTVILHLALIPRFGAMGAAVATMTGVVVQNLINHFGLATRTPVRVFDAASVRVYAWIALGTLLLWGVSRFDSLGPAVLIGIAVVASTVLLLVNRRALAISATFPELRRVPLLGLLGRRSARGRTR
jgi:O-antigen/teichoic acid export membrane protein